MDAAVRALVGDAGPLEVASEGDEVRLVLDRTPFYAEGGGQVNALAIESDEPGLSDYFEANVITGPGAFVMRAQGYRDFAAALRRKLIREISPREMSQLAAPAHAAVFGLGAYTAAIGAKFWQLGFAAALPFSMLVGMLAATFSALPMTISWWVGKVTDRFGNAFLLVDPTGPANFG